jgi:hypothetical protein
MSQIVENIVLPSKLSGVSEWTGYHTRLRKKYGKLNANVIFLMSWDKVGDKGLTDEPDFIDYFDKYGIDLSTPYDKAKAGIQRIGEDFLDLTGTFSKVAKYGIPIVAILLITWGSVTLVKNAKKNLGDVIRVKKTIDDISIEDKVKLATNLI